MFEFDCDGNWDVSHDAEILNKSLFGGAKKKKRKYQASKSNGFPSSSFSNTLNDSDDETFTKKGIRKLKEKRRKQKKQDKNLGESDNADVISTVLEKTQDSRTDSNSHLSKSSNSLKKSSKVLKTSKVENDLEEKSNCNILQDNKSKKRKRTSVAEVVKSSAAPNKKRKLKQEDNAVLDSSVLSKEESVPPQKRKRKRKKKNNSKKNKYAHLALNRKEKEREEAKEDNKFKNNKMATSGSLKKQESKLKTNSSSNDFHGMSKKNEIGSKRKEKNALKETDSVKTIPKKAKSKLKTVDYANGSVKTFGTSQTLSGDGNKPVAADVTLKKNRKRKKGLLNIADENSKAETIATKQNSNLKVFAKANTKMKEEPIKKVNENTQLKNFANEKSKTSSSASAKEHHTVKINDCVDEKKIQELQKRQKKLAQVLMKSGHGKEILESNSTNKTTKAKEKKKSRKKKKSNYEENFNTSCLKQKESSHNPTDELNKNPFMATSGLTKNVNKASHKSQSTQDVADSILSSSSIWGNKAATLGNQAQEKLNAARFRYLNEQLYTCQGSEALQMFKEDQDAFKVYHAGFENQAAKWPVNPVNVIIKQIKDKPPSLVVADFGCGDAKLAQTLPQKVYSFDLVALNQRVKACDMSNVPLQTECVDIAVFCLSLMGTNLDDYIHEANRVLKNGGLLKIVEVVSRFKGLSPFLAAVCSHGFQLLNKRDLSQMFYLVDFKKVKSVKKEVSTKSLSLKPCVYKKR